ncbi:putative branched-chain amino acid transport ATP-binding protein LivG [Sulfuracidifex tepidarius]|uniref:Branched-chain amino acid transport ATP-binding protein LivG n=1 Tax=Sulfuracidifex tepidarius TaxID=1294262 RepID=A0A510DXD5_9CREN|nr:ABC transporter ATP-binding protein [Sulfuracidifex tepidarius]BBG24839.1 putative branched-chain amino acid transport ATP-binding protein LivG [Sulfuracidifex tepidarius]
MMIVEAKDLTKRYGDYEALHSLSFEVQEGSIVAIVGPNGAGKSTLIRLIAGMLKRTSGIIRVFGKDPWSDYEAQRRISLVLDRTYLPQFLTVEEVLRDMASKFGKTMSDVVPLLEEFSASVFLKSKIKDLSTGTKQKIQIIFSLIKDPSLVLADEPTANLDIASRFEVYNTFLELKERGVTVIISSHLASELLSISTHLLGINGGTLKYMNSVSTLIRDDLMEEFYVVVDNVKKAINASAGFKIKVKGNEIKVKGDLADFVRALTSRGVRILYIRNSILEKSVMGELGWK